MQEIYRRTPMRSAISIKLQRSESKALQQSLFSFVSPRLSGYHDKYFCNFITVLKKRYNYFYWLIYIYIYIYTYTYIYIYIYIYICTLTSRIDVASRQLILWGFSTHNSVISATTYIKIGPNVAPPRLFQALRLLKSRNRVVQLPPTPLFQPPHHSKLEHLFDFHIKVWK